MFAQFMRVGLLLGCTANVAACADAVEASRLEIRVERLEKRVERLERKLQQARSELQLLKARSQQTQPRRRASHRTKNFIVAAQSADLARQTAEAAEKLRESHSTAWLGKPLDTWNTPCLIEIREVADSRAGVTSFQFKDGRATAFKMKLEGSKSDMLNELLPHEVLHTVFATHFRSPLPRWADEGAAISVESSQRHAQHDEKLKQFLLNSKTLPFRRMFELRDYPQNVEPLFAQGQSLVRFLLDRKGRRTFVLFVEDGLASDDWGEAVKRHYGYADLDTLQLAWTRNFAATYGKRIVP